MCVCATVDKLGKLHTKRLMVRFDNSESEHEHEIEMVTQQITDEFRVAEKGLQRMANRDQGDVSAADAKTRQNVLRYVMQHPSAAWQRSALVHCCYCVRMLTLVVRM